ncbi:Fe(2+)-trafficking protein [Candidatus Vidania fulgoroideae]|uniref:Fe(2+)-trafficking protein n=1 Tax=Candidatus Vidania fulgoroideorum TaxID=881286 RepID=A0AAX3NBW0_9PROT|nr:Fe(2+)-trafficking protein [Candidatus Vidania fulgoroideae]
MVKIKISKFIKKNFNKLKVWLKIQTILINEKKLNLKIKKDFLFLKQKFIYFCLKKFYSH